MTRKTVESILSKYGERVKCIQMDNARKIPLNLSNTSQNRFGRTIPNSNEIIFETHDDEDFMKVPGVIRYYDYTLNIYTLHPISQIQAILIADEDNVSGIDPQYL